jgi:primosomal protein N'
MIQGWEEKCERCGTKDDLVGFDDDGEFLCTDCMFEKKINECPECGGNMELEQDWDDDELVAEDMVCDNCGYRSFIY